MKFCNKCELDKDINDFNRAAREKDGHQPVCRSCQADYWQENKTKFIAAIKLRQKHQRLLLKNYVWEYLTKQPCIDCGEKDPVVLEFDHVRETKLKEISKLVSSVTSLENLKTEIAKCDVRCANCHRRKTSIEREFWRGPIV